MAPKKKESFELSKEDKEIIQETKIHEKREQLPQKTGVVLTGGIDSSVLLHETKGDKQPIVFDSESSNLDVIRGILEHEGITTEIKQFGKVTTKAEKKEVLQWCYENNVSPLSFATNIEEYNHNIGTLDMLEWVQLSSEMNNYNVQIAEPYRVINKHVLIQKAKDYGILELTAKPSESSKFKKIREEAFALAKIEDPHLIQEIENS